MCVVRDLRTLRTAPVRYLYQNKNSAYQIKHIDSCRVTLSDDSEWQADWFNDHFTSTFFWKQGDHVLVFINLMAYPRYSLINCDALYQYSCTDAELVKNAPRAE